MRSCFNYAPAGLILSLLFLSNCKKDDITTHDRISGRWTVSEVNFEVTIGDMSLADFFMAIYDVSQEEADAAVKANEDTYRESWTGTMEFKSDGKYVFDVGGEHYENNWFLSDDEKTIHVFFINYYMDLDIVSLDDHTMRLLFDQIYYQDFDGDNNKEAIKYSNDFILEK